MAAFFALLASSASAHVPVIYVTTSEEDWCGVIAAALGGDIIELAPGTYTGPCAITGKVSMPMGENTIVQSLDPTDPAVFVAGEGDHVFSVSGVRVVMTELSFVGLPAGVDAVHVGDADDIWVRYSTFDDIGGAAIRQTANLVDVTFENNELVGVGAMAVFGCGGTCTTGSALVEDNFADGAGEGITISVPSVATVRNNVLLTVAGTGIHVNGGDVDIDGNLVESATTGIVIDAGPALVRSQIVVAPVGIVAPGTGGEVRIVGNTVVTGGGQPLVLDGWAAGAGHRLADNAVDATLPDVHGADATGNVACVPTDACFTDAAGWDFYPPPGSLLRGAGSTDGELLSDWCGKARQDPPTPGALEALGDLSYGALPRTSKDQATCVEVVSPPPTDTGTDPIDTGTPPSVTEDVPSEGCSCAVSSSASAWPWLALVLAIRTRGRTSARRTARGDRPSR